MHMRPTVVPVAALLCFVNASSADAQSEALTKATTSLARTVKITSRGFDNGELKYLCNAVSPSLFGKELPYMYGGHRTYFCRLFLDAVAQHKRNTRLFSAMHEGSETIAKNLKLNEFDKREYRSAVDKAFMTLSAVTAKPATRQVSFLSPVVADTYDSSLKCIPTGGFGRINGGSAHNHRDVALRVGGTNLKDVQGLSIAEADARKARERWPNAEWLCLNFLGELVYDQDPAYALKPVYTIHVKQIRVLPVKHSKFYGFSGEVAVIKRGERLLWHLCETADHEWEVETFSTKRYQAKKNHYKKMLADYKAISEAKSALVSTSAEPCAETSAK